MGAIRLDNVEKWFADHQVIKGVDLAIEDGEFVIFVGPSGCGKSTLLRMIAGLEETSRGRILLDGNDVTAEPPSGRKLSMVFQSYALYPHMTVGRNMGFGLKTAGAPKAEIDRKVGEAARILKLDALLDRRPKALSGGQRQRVAIGRAIVREPKGFLFDEPLSNLDAALRVEMRFEIAKLHQTLETTMIYVTHDQVEAMTLADRIVVLKDGRIMQVGSPRDLYEHPANLFVAQFIGSPKMNVVAASRADQGARIDGQGAVPFAFADQSTEVSRLGIRPEDIQLVEPGDGTCRGTVEVIEYLGSDSFLYVTVPDVDTLTVRVGGGEQIDVGASVGHQFPPDKIKLFDPAEASIRPAD
ncbi:MAG: ABC transporter ATP-binding protein [Geminicoccaceae bacterium]